MKKVLLKSVFGMMVLIWLGNASAADQPVTTTTTIQQIALPIPIPGGGGTTANGGGGGSGTSPELCPQC